MRSVKIILSRVLVALLCLPAGLSALRAQEVIRVQNGAVLTVQNGASLTVAGGITLDNGSQLSNAGKIGLQNNTAGNAADWIDNTATAYDHGAGTVAFLSDHAQQFRSPNTFRRLEIGTAGLQLLGNISSAQWHLIRGAVKTGAFTAIATGTADTAVNADAANPGFAQSWIDGTLRRYTNPAAFDRYDFPVGNDTRANLAVLDNLQATPLTGVNYLDAYFSPKPGDDAGLLVTEGGTAYTMVNTCGVWHITPDQEPASGSYDLLLYFNGFDGLTDNSFGILRRPDASSDATEWAIPSGGVLPAAGAPGRIVSSGYARRNGIGAFSQFGIGMTSAPLPVTLIDFEAHRTSPALVALSWSTAMEENNYGFEIEERNAGDSAFHSRAFVASQATGGNSANTLTYRYTDDNANPGISYYRLKQTDLDGRFAYSAIRAVPGDASGRLSILLYPNPNGGQFRVRMEGNTGIHALRIIDAKGAVVQAMTIGGDDEVQVSGLAAGTYIVQVPDAFGAGKTFAQRVVVVR